MDRRYHFRARELPASKRFFGGSSPAGNTTTQTTSNPWAGQIPYITGGSGPVGAPDPNTGGQAVSNSVTGVLPAAAALYGDESAWPQYYPGQTYAPLTDVQQNVIGAITSNAATGGDAALQGANAGIANMLSPGYTDQTAGAFGNTQNYLNQSISGNQGVNQSAAPYNSSLAYQQNTINGQGVNQTQGAYNAGQNYLQSMISGSTLNPFTSPGFQNVINGTLASVIPATSASFINGGRSDSGLAQAAQTAAATNAIGSLANQNYLQEQGLQQSAAQQASSNQLAQQQLQANAESGAQQNYAQQQGLQQGAANLASNNALTQQGNQVKAAAVAPSIDQAYGSDLSNAYNADSQLQANQQNAINAAMQQWNYQQTLPFNMLGQYAQDVSGNYGSSGTTSSPYFQNTAANVLGGISGAAGTGLELGALASMIGGGGAAASGGASAGELALLAAAA